MVVVSLLENMKPNHAFIDLGIIPEQYSAAISWQSNGTELDIVHPEYVASKFLSEVPERHS